MLKARSSVLFSATLLPIQYYKELLAGTPDDYEIYAKSIFNPDKKGLFISSDVTSRYTKRDESQYRNIAACINAIVSRRHGNYLVFFPSYAFLNNVRDMYEEMFMPGLSECIYQTSGMKEEEKEEFLSNFTKERTDSLLVGFCVLGGIFSEGIDLKNDALIGAIVVGTGIPQVCPEIDLIRDFFDKRGESGYDYAYKFPGMNKVLQAAGRVIRTENDVGIVALLDERFLQNSYKSLFPREWANFEIISIDTVAGRVERFWNEWL